VIAKKAMAKTETKHIPADSAREESWIAIIVSCFFLLRIVYRMHLIS
jgi:hypothetical protein